LLHMKTGVGKQKARFDGLAAGARDACVEEARLRMATLEPEGFVARARIVYSVARAGDE
jgi:hypothetical protein